MRGQTTHPFAIRFYLRHSESGIDFQQTFRLPHTQRTSWQALVHQHMSPDNFFIIPPCTFYMITKIRLWSVIQYILLINVSIY